VTRESVAATLNSVLGGVTRSSGDRFDDAAEVFCQVALADEFPTFLTIFASSQYLVDIPERELAVA
jgi:malate synthase